MKFDALAIDDLLLSAQYELETDEDALNRVHAAYAEARLRFAAELAVIRAEREAEFGGCC